jgi:hypothetical protein
LSFCKNLLLDFLSAHGVLREGSGCWSAFRLPGENGIFEQNQSLTVENVIYYRLSKFAKERRKGAMQMRRGFSTAMVIVLGIAIASAQPYVHQKLGDGFSGLGSGVLSANGLPAWSASVSASPASLDIFRIVGTQNYSASILGNGTRTAFPVDIDSAGHLMWEGRGPNTNSFFDVFVDSSNASASLLGANRDAIGFRFAADGTAIWYGLGAATNDYQDIFVGSSNITQSVLGNNRDAVPVALNSSTLLWDGSGDNITGNRDVFKTTLNTLSSANVSQGPLGNSRFAIATDINSSGQALWNGSGSNTNGYTDTYREFSNISATPLGGAAVARDSFASDISDTGYVAWVGRASAVTGNFNDVFLFNGNASGNISRAVLGTTAHDALGVAVNGANHLLWEGAGSLTNNWYDAFLTVGANTFNISRTTLGTAASHEATSLGLDADGNVLWKGYSSSTTANKTNLFYYNRAGNSNTNLTQAALSRNSESDPLAVNGAGQILWAARNAADTSWEIWLSTPNRATTLTGTVDLGGFSGDPAQVQLEIKLINPLTGAVAQTVNTNLLSNSTYSVAVTPGLWQIRIDASRFLARAFSVRRVLDATTLDFSLINGDVNGDNTVDDADLLAVLFAFGSSTNDPVDLNGDGVVDDADLLIVLFNFGTSGE